MRRQLVAGVLMVAVFTVLCGVVYPLVVTSVAQLIFPRQANGSLIEHAGRPVGSSLIGQPFSQAKYFHPRPSASAYDASHSGGSNDGPTNPAFLKAVKQRIDAYRAENGLGPHADVPVDAVTASASGLDPDISVANARLQANRVARERHLSLRRVMTLIREHTESRTVGFLGETRVNVLEVNLALDRVT